MIITARITNVKKVLPQNSSRASAYPAMLEATRIPKTAVSVYPTLFSRYFPRSP